MSPASQILRPLTLVLIVASWAGCATQPSGPGAVLGSRAEAERWVVQTVEDGTAVRAEAVGPGEERKTIMEAGPGLLSTQRVGSEFVEVRVSCGNPCSRSAFVSTRTGRVSEVFSDVLAVDPIRARVAVPTHDGISVYGMRGGNDLVTSASLRLSPVAAPPSAFVEVEFEGAEVLRVVYLRGADFESDSVRVALPTDGP